MALNPITEEIFNQYINNSRREKQRRRRVTHFIVVIVFVGFLFSFIGIARIGHSDMGDAYQEGDIIIYEKLTSDYKMNDVVLVRYGDHILMRRVIGVYKDKIDIDNNEGILWINDQKEENSQMTMTDPLGVKFPLYVSKNQYFILCDKRTTTTDSRSFGCIQENQIIGKIIYKIRF